jgi:hypothetical protein
MPLSMRPTGSLSPVDKDRKDYTVYSGGWAYGRHLRRAEQPRTPALGSGQSSAFSPSRLTYAPMGAPGGPKGETLGPAAPAAEKGQTVRRQHS